ncbi:MAG: hypothetical protein R2875_16355 [Desulfobacterales bacterium]
MKIEGDYEEKLISETQKTFKGNLKNGIENLFYINNGITHIATEVAAGALFFVE